jgi:flagellar M-ring protein FliF
MEQLKRLLATLSNSQRWTILVAAVLISAGLYSLVHWEKESAFRPLYTTLAPEDASVVIQKLKEGSTEYRLSNNGTTVSVPEDKVAELRLELAAAGVPKSGRIGFEIFDKTNFGMTDFAEHINYRRAVEGELERSVMAIAEVEQARVHITFPKESVFSEAQQPAKASVLIKIRPGASLPETAIPAITHLISSAVEGLAPESVSVLDMRGNLLNRAKRAGVSSDDSSDAALEYRHKVEQDLTSKLDATLEPLVGAGRYRASVSAETDLTSGEQSEESFDPTKSAMVSSQTTEDTSTPTRAIAGIPGTASNLPDAAPRPQVTGGGTSRKTENVTYQTSRTVKRTVLPQGSIKRLSVSVLIDHEAHWEGTGANAKRVLVPPSPERMKVIHDLVATTAGFNMDRGDQLFVEALPFESTLNLDPPPSALPAAGTNPKQLSPIEQLKSNPKLLGISGAAVVALLAGCGFLYARMKKSSDARAAQVQMAQALPEGSAAGSTQELSRAAAAAQDSWAPSGSTANKVPTLAPARLETLTAQLRETAQKDAEICVGVLRGWLKEGQV